MSHVEVDSPPGATHIGEHDPAGPLHPPRIWASVLTAGLVAGFVSWLIGEAIHARYGPPEFINIAGSSGGFISTAEVQKLTTTKRTAQIFEASLTFGSVGALLGLALGLAGFYVRRPAESARKAALLGTILGGVVGAVVIAGLLPIYLNYLNPDTNDLILGILIQATVSAAVGAVGGAAFAVGLGDRSRPARAVIGGLLGAVAGVIVFDMAGAIAFPLDRTSSPISATWHTRLFARLAVAILASAGVAMGVLDQTKRDSFRHVDDAENS